MLETHISPYTNKYIHGKGRLKKLIISRICQNLSYNLIKYQCNTKNLQIVNERMVPMKPEIKFLSKIPPS